LEHVYAGMVRSRRLEQIVEQIDEIDMEDCEPPEDLERRVREVLEKHPTIRWDAAVQQIAERAAK
jgi:tetrahydromethanopterin S-methyltransferase subunit A